MLSLTWFSTRASPPPRPQTASMPIKSWFQSHFRCQSTPHSCAHGLYNSANQVFRLVQTNRYQGCRTLDFTFTWVHSYWISSSTCHSHMISSSTCHSHMISSWTCHSPMISRLWPLSNFNVTSPCLVSGHQYMHALQLHACYYRLISARMRHTTSSHTHTHTHTHTICMRYNTMCALSMAANSSC